MIRICPSILNADRDNLSIEIARISTQSDLLHLDVMDNIFVPNFTFTFEQSEKIIAECPIPVDSHLMIADPDNRAHLYAKAGSASVTFHFEASANPLETISRIKNEGARVGVALKPATPFHKIASLMEHIDMVLIMTVEPGFGGQSFMFDMMEKVKEKVIKKAPWIIKQQSFFLSFQPKTTKRKYISGETHLYLGRQYRLQISFGIEESVKLKGKFIHVTAINKSKVKHLLNKWYLEHAQLEIMQELAGVLKPDVIERKFVKPKN